MPGKSDGGAFPLGSTVYLDECKTRSYSLAAAACPSAQSVLAVARTLRRLVRPGQRRIHFKSESDSSRRRLLSEMVELDVRVRLYEISGLSDRLARAACLEALLDDIARSGTRRLLIERDASVEVGDRRIIRAHLERIEYRHRLEYSHREPYGEPLLWVSDAVAWCRQAGGEWRRRSAPLIDAVVSLERC